MRNRIGSIVLWGSLWGITEATLGYFLHMLPVNIGWVVWFPLAFFFLSTVRKKTGNSEAMMFIALIAAAIKFVDVMLPGTIDRVVNPSVSILLEALTVFLYYRIIVDKGYPAVIEYAGAFAMSFLWRILYAGYILLLPVWMVNISPVADSDAFINFLLFQGAVNGICMTALFGLLTGRRSDIKAGTIKHDNRINMKMAIPYFAFLVAIVVQKVL